MKNRIIPISLIVVGIVLGIGVAIASIAKNFYQSEHFKSQKPEITYAEFPFRLEYEINGKRKIIEDVWICEFDGFDTSLDTGKSRRWKGKLKSNGEDKIVLLDVAKPKETWEGKPKSQIIFYHPGTPGYYMGERIGTSGWYTPNRFPDAYILERYSITSISEGIIEAKELYERFGIKLLDWQYTKPIKNTFKQ